MNRELSLSDVVEYTFHFDKLLTNENKSILTLCLIQLLSFLFE